MRVAVDARMVDHSGIGRYLRSLVPSILSRNGDLEFWLLGSPERLSGLGWDRQPNVRVVECHAGIYSVAEQIALQRRLPGKLGLFWSPHYNIPLLRRERLLVTVHDLCHLAFGSALREAHKRLYARGLLAAIRRRADAVITVSAFSRDEFYRLVGPPRCAVHVIPNGIEVGWLTPDPSEAEVHPGRPFLLFVGNLKPHKNVGVLLEAFRRLKDRIPHDLVIVGRKEGLRTVDRRALEIGRSLGDRVRFTGRVSDARLAALYQHATALVFPSRYEGFGLPVLEAMASGCPAVVSNVASLPEVGGDAVLYFDPLRPEELADRLLLLVQDQELRDRMRSQGLVRSRSFSWTTTAQRTSEVIRSLLGVGDRQWEAGVREAPVAR